MSEISFKILNFDEHDNPWMVVRAETTASDIDFAVEVQVSRRKVQEDSLFMLAVQERVVKILREAASHFAALNVEE